MPDEPAPNPPESPDSSPKQKSARPSPPQSGLAAFWQELRRRKVVRVAVAYAVVAWLIIQVAVSTFPSLYIPGWALSFVIMCVILGFPVALVLAWAFELTPEGIRSAKVVRKEVADTEVSASHAKKRNWFSLLFAAAVPTVIFGTLALFFYIRSGGDSDAAMGRLAEAEFIHEELWRSDPLGTWANRNLFHTYSLRKNWEKARSLIRHNFVRGSELDEIWRFRKAILEFIQLGNQQAFASAVQTATDFEEVEAKRMKIRAALYNRDLETALQVNEEVNATLSNESSLTRARYIPQIGFSQIPFFGESFTIEPTQLLSALIWFELNERDRWLKEVENAKSYLESVIETNPNATPIYYSNLALSYALEGKQEATKSIIQQTRERTQKSPEQYKFQVHSELHIAIAYLVLGDHDKAIETLEAASRIDGPIFLNRELELWFIFDRLKGNPRFDRLLEG